MIEEKNLSGDILLREIDNILYKEENILKMKNSLSKLNAGDSASIIYDNIKKLVGRNSK